MKSPARQRVQAVRLLFSRLWSAFVILALAIITGTVGYWVLGDGVWSWAECAYMTLITLSTVGYAETLGGMDHVYGARAWTVLIIVLGSGTLLYFASTLTAFIVEGDLRGVLRRNRMLKRIARLEEHYVVAGAGRTGLDIIRELIATHMPFVVIDTDEERLSTIGTELDTEVLYIVGNAEDDEVLLSAGIERARGLAAALPEDRDNLFVTLSSRSLNDKLRIVAKAVEPASPPKLYRAGADSVVSTTYIGAMRLCSELIRPHVVEFLDAMLRSNGDLRVGQVAVGEGSSAAGRRLGDTGIARAKDLIIMAARLPDGEYIHIPSEDLVVPAGTELIVMAKAKVTARWIKALAAR